jgi:excinuclease ABC subunit A
LTDEILVRGAEEHNLKSIDVRFPKRRISVITGVSGSGKSTLAFDVLYSEGQRRYVECVSSYAKQFLERVPRPKVGSIDGLCPALAIRPTGGSRSARSTVGTTTETYDYLRLLFARIGVLHCASCGAPVASEALKEIAEEVLSFEGSQVVIAFPMKTKGASAEALAGDLLAQGFLRLYFRGRIVPLDDKKELKAAAAEDQMLVVADRISVRPGIEKRLADSLELAFSRGGGTVYVTRDGGEPRRYSKGFTCDACGAQNEPPTPLLFSFNSPAGACPECRGFGNILEFDQGLIIPDPTKTIREGAVLPWAGKWRTYFLGRLKKLEKEGLIRIDVPFKKLTASEKKTVLHGRVGFKGVLPMLEKFKRKSYKKGLRFIVKKYQSPVQCRACGGSRLRREALSVKIGGATITDVSAKTVEGALSWIRGLDLSAMELAIGERVIGEISGRLSTLVDMGVGYLTLNRLTRTLSSGEEQRIELAGALGARLADTLYILDEPTVGLHPRDTARLISALQGLRDAGNTVVVVEHDRDVIRAADWIVDLGPGAGRAGGDVLAQCDPSELAVHKDSVTGRYLSGMIEVRPSRADRKGGVPDSGGGGRPNGSDRKGDQGRRGSSQLIRDGSSADPAYGALGPGAPRPPTAVGSRVSGKRRRADDEILPSLPTGFILINGARARNLKNVDVRIPLGRMISVTGVSGAGKSSLVEEILYPACLKALGRPSPGKLECDAVKDADLLDDVVLVDRSPIGKSPRSNPVTYLKAFDSIRQAFAGLPESKARGYSPGTFSFNVPGGRCEACKGEGSVKVEMYFLADLYLDCEECDGARYKREVLEVKYKGKSIKDVLDCTVDEALSLFSERPEVGEKLWLLQRVGLGYLTLGQAAPTLSGGEAQRVKIARELSRGRGERILYILDEPTIGLHFADIERLMSVLRSLVAKGNTVLMIEHNVDVIGLSDWVIDLGPGGGDLEGGNLVAQGTPKEVASCDASHTGRFLAERFDRLRDRVGS